MEEYKPKHPQLEKTIDDTHGIQIHVNCMGEINNLDSEKKKFISNKFLNTLPLMASNNESALLCHLQHVLENNNIIKPGINVYCMYVLENYHYEDEEGGFIKSLINSV